MPRKNHKPFSSSLTLATKNPLSAIRSACEKLQNNLNQTLEYLDLISVSAKRGLYVVEVVLNEGPRSIDERKFVYILISTVVEAALREYAFESYEQRSLVSVNLADDFDFKGDEDLMIFVILSLFKNSLHHRAKINIWLDSKARCLYLRDDRDEVLEEELGMELKFCKRVMKAFGGGIDWGILKGEGVELCLKFPSVA